MALQIIKTTKLVGRFMVNEVMVKEVTVDIDEKGVSKTYEYIPSESEAVFAANRKEIRKQEKEFRDKRYEVEDAILAELEKEDEGEA